MPTPGSIRPRPNKAVPRTHAPKSYLLLLHPRLGPRGVQVGEAQKEVLAHGAGEEHGVLCNLMVGEWGSLNGWTVTGKGETATAAHACTRMHALPQLHDTHLRDVRHGLAQRALGHRGQGDLPRPHQDLARVGLVHAGKERGDGGFARARGPHERDGFPLPDVEVEVLLGRLSLLAIRRGCL